MGGGGGGGLLGGITNIVRPVLNPIGAGLEAIGGAIGGGAGRQIAGAVNPINYILPESAKAPEQPQVPGEDPRLGQIRSETGSLADEFRRSQGQTRNTAIKSLQEAERDQLSTELGQSQKNFNRRGLLYSGLSQGSQEGLRASSAGRVASGTQSVNKAITEQQAQLDRAAANAQLSQAATQGAIQDSIMNAAIQNTMARQAAMSGLGSAIGQIGGAAIARGRS